MNNGFVITPDRETIYPLPQTLGITDDRTLYETYTFFLSHLETLTAFCLNWQYLDRMSGSSRLPSLAAIVHNKEIPLGDRSAHLTGASKTVLADKLERAE